MPIFLLIINLVGALGAVATVQNPQAIFGVSSSNSSAVPNKNNSNTWYGLPPTSDEVALYETMEYDDKDSGKPAIYAADAYAILSRNQKPVGGDGVIVGVVDTGVKFNHRELQGKGDGLNNFLPIGISITSADNHATHVAGIIAAKRDGLGMHGVAFNSRILSVAITLNIPTDTSYKTQYGLDSTLSFDYASANGARVINASFGGSGPNMNDYYVNARNAGSLLVAATGNEALTQPASPANGAGQPDFEGYIIAVASIDPETRAFSSFSNQCGSNAAYCISAPGENIYSSVGAGAVSPSYALYSGTSMAAPHVSGAAAVLIGAWPQLTAPQVSDILFRTADKSVNGLVDVANPNLGFKQTSAMFGQGILNLYSAVQYVGPKLLVSGGSIAGINTSSTNSSSSLLFVSPQSGSLLSDSAISSSAIFGDSLTKNLASALNEAVFVDAYGRDFKAFLGQNINFANSTSNLIVPISLNSGFVNNHNLPLNLSSNSNFRSISAVEKSDSKTNLILSFSNFKNAENQARYKFPNTNLGLVSQSVTSPFNSGFSPFANSAASFAANFGSGNAVSNFAFTDRSIDPRFQLQQAGFVIVKSFENGSYSNNFADSLNESSKNLLGKTNFSFASNLDYARKMRFEEGLGNENGNKINDSEKNFRDENYLNSGLVGTNSAVLNSGFISQSPITANPFNNFFTNSSAITANSGNFGSFMLNPQADPRSFANLNLLSEAKPSSSGQNLAGDYFASNQLFALTNKRKFNQFYFGQDLLKNKEGSGLINGSFIYQNSFDNQSLSNSLLNSFSGQKQNQLFDFAIGFRPKAGSLIIASVGRLEEFAGNMLNSKSLGAFATGSNPKTGYFKIASTYQLPMNLILSAAISEAQTDLSGNQNGVFRGFSQIKSRNSSVSLSYDGEKNPLIKGKLGIGYSEPMRVYRGRVNYDIAVAVDQNLNVIRKTGSVSLVPSGLQRDYEMFFQKHLGKHRVFGSKTSFDGYLKLNLILQTQPNNVASAKSNLVGMLNYGVWW